MGRFKSWSTSQNAETQILWYLAVQIRIEILDEFEFAVAKNPPTIREFDLHFDEHFESHLLGNGLYSYAHMTHIRFNQIWSGYD